MNRGGPCTRAPRFSDYWERQRECLYGRLYSSALSVQIAVKFYDSEDKERKLTTVLSGSLIKSMTSHGFDDSLPSYDYTPEFEDLTVAPAVELCFSDDAEFNEGLEDESILLKPMVPNFSFSIPSRVEKKHLTSLQHFPNSAEVPLLCKYDTSVFYGPSRFPDSAGVPFSNRCGASSACGPSQLLDCAIAPFPNRYDGSLACGPTQFPGSAIAPFPNRYGASLACGPSQFSDSAGVRFPNRYDGPLVCGPPQYPLFIGSQNWFGPCYNSTRCWLPPSSQRLTGYGVVQPTWNSTAAQASQFPATRHRSSSTSTAVSEKDQSGHACNLLDYETGGLRALLRQRDEKPAGTGKKRGRPRKVRDAEGAPESQPKSGQELQKTISASANRAKKKTGKPASGKVDAAQKAAERPLLSTQNCDFLMTESRDATSSSTSLNRICCSRQLDENENRLCDGHWANSAQRPSVPLSSRTVANPARSWTSLKGAFLFSTSDVAKGVADIIWRVHDDTRLVKYQQAAVFADGVREYKRTNTFVGWHRDQRLNYYDVNDRVMKVADDGSSVILRFPEREDPSQNEVTVKRFSETQFQTENLNKLDSSGNTQSAASSTIHKVGSSTPITAKEGHRRERNNCIESVNNQNIPNMRSCVGKKGVIRAEEHQFNGTTGFPNQQRPLAAEHRSQVTRSECQNDISYYAVAPSLAVSSSNALKVKQEVNTSKLNLRKGETACKTSTKEKRVLVSCDERAIGKCSEPMCPNTENCGNSGELLNGEEDEATHGKPQGAMDGIIQTENSPLPQLEEMNLDLVREADLALLSDVDLLEEFFTLSPEANGQFNFHFESVDF